MKIELHLLQNFAPSNLNRGDTGTPKDCEFGGYRRARISSQCQKRAVRQLFQLRGLLAEEELGARTKRLAARVADDLQSRHGLPADEARRLALGAIEGCGLGLDTKDPEGWKTQYLLFVPRRVVGALADLLFQHREDLASTAPTAAANSENPGDSDPASRSGKSKAKKQAKAAYPTVLRKAVEAVLKDAGSTVDLALFGRMIADKPEWNVEAACQVAHAISTNRVEMDFDFFTAVDDFRLGDTAGSDMMGTVEFNSSCFYRYAVLDVDALRENLGGGETGADALVRKAVDGFVKAFVSAIPTGKQNSMAAHNFPSYVLAVVRDGGQPLSLTNAFLKPARPGRRDAVELDLVDDSITKLESYFSRMRDVPGGTARAAVRWADRDLSDAAGTTVAATLGELFEALTRHAAGPGA